ncbi:hypothetical protein PR048_032447 [Dryococelus australis]|uniref:DUF5641 domain-containing protein n=1 Tax=Dryococelus australis TaxID=614101 RepID=A0ABQ9G276_9NEOP|nr:hypothetical protein PR048_032447 [Dryococelus australis]
MQLGIFCAYKLSVNCLGVVKAPFTLLYKEIEYQNENLVINTRIDNTMKQPVMATENVIQLCQIFDTTKTNLKSIHSMGQQTYTWDDFIIDVLVQRLDSKTKLEWELHWSSKFLPTLEKLFEFLNHKCSALEGLQLKTRQLGKASDGTPPGVRRSQIVTLNQESLDKPRAAQDSYCSLKDTRMSHVLLATAKVNVKDRSGKLQYQVKDCLSYRTPDWDISYLKEYSPPTPKVMSDNKAIHISLRPIHCQNNEKFCKATYGACIYIQSTDQDGNLTVKIHLFLPRLEQCGAVLLANLNQKVSEALKVTLSQSYCLRFIHNYKNKDNKNHGILKPSELSEAAILCIKQIQAEVFHHEIHDLSSNQMVSNKSSLKSLSPFLDGRHLLRVGRRLEKSSPPHLGHLWEAVIKSVKFILQKVTGNACLTFEEFNTVLCQVEDVLPNLVIGSGVIIKEDNLPPLVWKKGIITEVGLVRVATIKSATGDFKRPVDELCLIPVTE